jgi:hypothetical protein
MMSSPPVRRSGVALTEASAQDIYREKLQLEEGGVKTSGARIKGPSSEIARLYNVSPKTVRDIWNRVTWKYATSHLWNTSHPEENTSVEQAVVGILSFFGFDIL